MFLSTSHNKIDLKCRVSIPSSYRFQLEKEGKKLPEAQQTGYTTLEDKQLERIRELSGLTLNSTRMVS